MHQYMNLMMFTAVGNYMLLCRTIILLRHKPGSEPGGGPISTKFIYHQLI